MNIKRLTDFKLNAFFPYVPELEKSVETGITLGGIFHWMDAEVPGSIHHDLLKAGLIRDPYFEMQSMESEWVKDRWWTYQTDFILDCVKKDKHYNLRLKGIDYRGHIVLDGEKLGVHEGMYTPFLCDITDLMQQNQMHRLSVTLESAPDEFGQIGYTEQTTTQKARFTYKWDWCPRLVQLGLWDDVLIEEYGSSAIRYSNIASLKGKQELWRLENKFEIYGFESAESIIHVALYDDGNLISANQMNINIHNGMQSVCCDISVKNPRLWYPNGLGEQPIYQLVVEIFDHNGISDRVEYQVGFRTLEYTRCMNASNDSLPYNVIVNGKKVYIKGVNITPLDMMYGTVTEDRYKQILMLAQKANINLIRVWGGGIIEKEAFYNICDRLGLMVWQEFIQSSSGINNVPSKNQHFLKLLNDTAVEAVQVKRNHVSLTFWSGGNELTDIAGVPVNFKDENIKLLYDVVKQYDPYRLMLPTSASGPLEFLDIDKKGQNHDVHGPWKYEGTTRHYTIYNESDSQLHSEFGIDGMANREELDSFMLPKNRYAVSMADNITWRHHGEWWDTFERDSNIFGLFQSNELEQFILCSQFIQGESLRYAVEANRRRMYENCGSIVWQFNEPWPNAVGTNLINYSGQPKAAYCFLRDAYRTVSPTLQYDKILYDVGEVFIGKIFIVNDKETFFDQLLCSVIDSNGKKLFQKEYDVEVSENSKAKIDEFNIDIHNSDGFFVTLELKNKQITSQYLVLIKNQNGYASRPLVKEYMKDYYK